jgi:CRP-like cAMP-binding protein
MMVCNCEQCDLKLLFFGSVGASELENICARKVEKDYKNGDLIIREGDEIKDFIYLKSGLVKLYRTRGSDDQIITIAKPFDFVSLLSAFSEKKYNYSVAAVEDSTVCTLDMNFVLDMAKNNSGFAYNIITRMSKVSDTIILNMLNIREKHLRGRIAYLLLYFSDTIYNKPAFELPVSRKEIAELISMTTENVIRILSEFRKDGVIKIYGKVIEIVDHERLGKISELG